MTRTHLLVTNDFPPKVGGIQNYLWELWRRLPDGATSVYTTPYAGTAAFDARQPFPIERSPEPWLIPYPWLPSRVSAMAERVGAELVLFDPALPVGAIGPHIGLPYGVILHGAEVTIPGRVPGLRSLMARTLRQASLVVSAGAYALAEAERCAGRTLPSVVIPPGVDSDRFVPADAGTRAATRARFGVPEDGLLLATVSRLVPRKGMETLIRAGAVAADRLRGSGTPFKIVIGGTGRQATALQELVDRLGAPVELPGRLSDQAVVDLYGSADLMAMLCNARWGGLEQEGFGIVFLEAAAAGIPQIAGRSGGAHEAVADGQTGLVIDDPTDVDAAASAIVSLLEDPVRRKAMGERARERATEEFDYDTLAERLQTAIDRCRLVKR
ncbi:MAG: glycosyltransferase family 4 protein [Actinomycetota bacterium]